MARKTAKLLTILLCSACLGLFFLLSSFFQKADAGFEWVPSQVENAAPEAVITGTAPPPAPIMPLPVPDEIAPIAPQPLQEEDTALMPAATEEEPLPAPIQAAPAPAQSLKTKIFMPEDAPQAALEGAPGSETLHMNINPQPEMTAPTLAPAPEMTSPAPEETMQDIPAHTHKVVGFGTDMPLAIALGQIVPPNHTFSFGERVNPGLKVSWNGGAAWQDIISEMIKPLNLVALFHGRSIYIRATDEQAASAPVEEPLSEKPLEVSIKTTLGDPPEPVSGETDSPSILTLLKQEPETIPPEAEKENISRININDPGLQAEQQKAQTIERIERILPPADPVDPVEDTAAAPDPETLLPEPIKAEIRAKDAIEYQQAAPPPSYDKKPTIIASSDPAITARLQNKPHMDLTARDFWEVRRGASLRETLTAWGTDAHTTLVWEAAHDYVITHDLMINDTFQNAIKALFTRALEGKNKPSLEFISAQNAETPGTLVIHDRR